MLHHSVAKILDSFRLARDSRGDALACNLTIGQMPHFYVVGPDANSGDILMATLVNECKDLPGAPQTEFLLVVQCLDQSGSLRMMRVVGVTKQTMKSWNHRNEVLFIDAVPEVKELLRNYFSSRWERFKQYTAAATEEPPLLSKLIH
jgi:hypothetical protein